MARKQYNYRLAERLNWFEATRTPVNPCPLNVSVVPVERIYQNVPEFRTQTRDGRKKDGNCLRVTKKGDKHPNIINGYVAWETVQLADLAQTKNYSLSISLSTPRFCRMLFNVYKLPWITSPNLIKTVKPVVNLNSKVNITIILLVIPSYQTLVLSKMLMVGVV